MLNPETGMDDVKCYSLAVAVTVHLRPGFARERALAVAIDRLAAAVTRDAGRRACRDTDPIAASLVRAWGA